MYGQLFLRKTFVKDKFSVFPGLNSFFLPIIVAEKGCAHFYESGERKDGMYTIDPDGFGTFQVWCDMQTVGGWTVFQRRHGGSVNFYLNWSEYKVGFGNLSGEFWLGLDKIHRLTKSNQSVLRVDLMDIDGSKGYAQYMSFSVASESESYKLNVGNFSGKYITTSIWQIN